MSLDQNLFTLNITPKPNEPLIVELIDSKGTVHYRKERVDPQLKNGLYEFNMIDPLSGSSLATISAPGATNKHKTIELHNPTVPVELKYTGTLKFRWSFKWEEHEFEWKREECHLIRKPDPPVLVAITREPPGRIKTKTVQILDYNLHRFDINDRKGLEIVILSALLSFQDYSDEYHAKKEDSSPATVPQPVVTPPERTPEPREAPPELPPKPKKSGAELIAAMQKGELGEVIVEEDGNVKDYAQYCSNLLEGDNMLFIVLKSSTPATVPKVLSIALEAKRIRHREGVDEELYQYVQYDAAKSIGKKGPRVINLDNNAEGKDRYKPPENLILHLSKIEMPELRPSTNKGKGKMPEHVENDKDRKKKERDAEKERERRARKEKDKHREHREREKESGRSSEKGKSKGRSTSLDRAESGRLKKRPPVSQVPSHHPSQLNNTPTYTVPQPRPYRASLVPPSSGNTAHQRTGSSPMLMPPTINTHVPNYGQRPVSAYGSYHGVPPTTQQQPQQQRSSSSPLLSFTSLLERMKIP